MKEGECCVRAFVMLVSKVLLAALVPYRRVAAPSTVTSPQCGPLSDLTHLSSLHPPHSRQQVCDTHADTHTQRTHTHTHTHAHTSARTPACLASGSAACGATVMHSMAACACMYLTAFVCVCACVCCHCCCVSCHTTLQVRKRQLSFSSSGCCVAGPLRTLCTRARHAAWSSSKSCSWKNKQVRGSKPDQILALPQPHSMICTLEALHAALMASS